MTRYTGIVLFVLLSLVSSAQGDQQVRAKADGLFEAKNYADALPLYSQLVSLVPGDRVLNYRFGTCLLFGGEDKSKAIGHLKFATQDPAIPADAWYWLGRAYHLNYQFKEAQAAYQRYQGTGTKKELEGFSVAALDKQCRNGQNLLSNLKEINVRNKVEVDDTEFFRFYELGDIGGRIVVLPEELKSALDKKSKQRTLVYIPETGGRAIYFSSYGKDGKTGRDIYRTELTTDGKFAPPIKLAGYVNTDQDEDFAFLHPDGKTFYFSSKGHNSMGGYDVFRSVYDKGLDAFGPAENMDFAVNTPDDDVFYMTDAENKEACFASGRDSKQGKLHVYRVSTAQVPLVVTVLKGTYASAFDQNDRKARIIVQDAVTHEKVADVRTDINGSYVLSIPRSGRFKFFVECGPSGKTHTGTVDVPRSSSALAYRQELELTRTGDLEALVIRNYFEEPLEEDMIALMMEEIKRRAKLDVSTSPQRAVEEPLADEPETNDPLTKAGFSGDVTEVQAVRMAKEDAAALDRLAYDLDLQSKEAFSIAVQAVTEAERSALEAETLVNAAAQEVAEVSKNAKMVEAATLRQRSREANLRARAAFRTGQDLEAERMAVQQRAATASKLAMDLDGAVSTKKADATLAYLQALKARLDTKAGPDGDLSVTERSRRSLAEQEKEAARSLNMATAKRAEENEFADRIARSKRERDETRSKPRKEELSREITEQEQQLAYLHDEVEGAFTKAREFERTTAILRGQHSLTAHLSTTQERRTGTELNKEQMAGLGQRIAGNDSRIASIPIDERYEAQLVQSSQEVEARTFDWGGGSSPGASLAAAANTRSAQRDPSKDPQKANGRTITASQVAPDQAEPHSATIPVIGSSNIEDLASAAGAVGRPDPQQVDPEEQAPGISGEQEDGSALDRATTDVAPDVSGNTADGTGSTGETGLAGDAPPRTTQGIPEGADASEAAAANTGISTRVPDARTTDRAGVSGSTQGVAAEAPAPHVGATMPDPAGMDVFILENEKAELQQAIAAEKNKPRRDSLQTQLARVNLLMASAQRSETGAGSIEQEEPVELDQVGVDMTRTPIMFFPDTKEADIIALVYPGFEVDQARVEAIEDPTARAEGSSGLQLMLADSLREELVRQAAVLELAPQQGALVLPKMERLRMIRQERLRQAERIMQEHEAAMATQHSPLFEGTAQRATNTAGERYPAGSDPVADRFIALDHDPQEIYASKVEHRSRNVDDAVAFKDADLARMADLDQRIDSIEAGMIGMARKDYDKQRREADKLIDERMIIRSDLGQRSAFLTKEEWRTAMDSLKGIDRQLSSKGLPPNENLLLMAQRMQADAKTGFAEAEVIRKKADRSEDILLRDSLFRTAYAKELEALSEVDKAITVKTYLIGPGHQRGETLAYDEVARRVLGITDGSAIAQERAAVPTNAVLLPSDPAPGTAAVAVVAPQDSIAHPDTAEQAQDHNRAERAVPANGGRAEEGGTIATEHVAERAGPTGTPSGTGVMSSGTPNVAGSADEARRQAGELADRTVAASPSNARLPIERYESFLRQENVILKQEALDPDLDPRLLAVKAEKAGQQSASLEQRSLELADRATALEDSASTARKRDQEKLMALALRTRSESDSLHGASLAMAEEARSLEMQKRDAEQAKALRDRLVKYYYLTGEEQGMVLDNPDQSRFFQARARALEQYDAASEADASARINRQLSEVLRKEADATKAEVAAGRSTQEEASARREVLYTRAEALATRADSLSNVAARLRGAAGINEGQASVMLQGLPADRSTEWMALEMRTRRTEPMLADTREPVRPVSGAPGQEGTVPDVPGTATAIPVGATREDGAKDPSDATNSGAVSAAEPRTGGTNGLAADARPARNITAPFGTDSPLATSARPRPIMEVPAMPAFPEELVHDIFDLRPNSSGHSVMPIAMDAPMPKGIVFKVQIGAFRHRIREDVFSDMTPVMGEHTDSGLIRYTAGLFMGFHQAATAKDKVRDRGYRDAFVVAYRDGVRIPLGVAMREARAEELASSRGPATEAPTASAATEQQERPMPTTRTTTHEGNTVLEPVRTDLQISNPAVARPMPAAVGTPVLIPPMRPMSSEEILAKYPATAEAIMDAFGAQPDAASYYNVPGAAPADQVELIKGLFYTVQVGVYSKPVPLDKLFNIVPLNSERTETAKIRYTTGRYLDTEQARVRKEQAVSLGVKDAFITAYLNGKRIPMQEAAALLQQFGPSILARP